MNTSEKAQSKPVATLLKMLVLAVCMGVLACVLGACAGSGGNSASDLGGITVSASSETKVVPDKARIGASVVTEAKTAEECQNKNAQSVNAVIDALKALGIEKESIQTNYSNLSPRYGSRVTDKSKDEEEAYDEWVITGYEMSTNLTVSDLEIDNVGAVIQACVSAGANQTSGVEYYASNYDEAYNEALAKALDTAKSKAENIATSTGTGLGKVTSVTEGYQDTSARYMSKSNEMYAMAEDASADGDIAQTMPGQIDIRAEVTVTYAIS